MYVCMHSDKDKTGKQDKTSDDKSKLKKKHPPRGPKGASKRKAAESNAKNIERAERLDGNKLIVTEIQKDTS